MEKNPLGLVPTLETPSGQVIYESPITCEYLDEVYPNNKLLPSDPFEKAQQKMMLECYSKVGLQKLPVFYFSIESGFQMAVLSLHIVCRNNSIKCP